MDSSTPNTGSWIPKKPFHGPFRLGFTLTEVLTVIAVVGVLLAVIIPSLRSLSNQAVGATELAAARQLSQGYVGYATDTNGELMPGYLSQSPGDQHYEGNYEVQGPDGNLLGGPAKRRWTWRILPYLDDAVDSLFVNEARQYIDQRRGTDGFAYLTSVFPSFGLNGEWIGGMQGSIYSDLHTLGRFTGECYYAQRLAEVQRPADQLLFGSSRGGGPQGDSDVEGFFFIQSPYYFTTGWRWAEDESGAPVYEQPLAPSKSGYLSMRLRDKSATAMLDGSTSLRSMQELADMRLWTNRAWKPDWVLDLQNP